MACFTKKISKILVSNNFSLNSVIYVAKIIQQKCKQLFVTIEEIQKVQIL